MLLWFKGAASILLKAVEDTKSFFKTCVSLLAVSLLQESHCVKIWETWTLTLLCTSSFSIFGPFYFAMWHKGNLNWLDIWKRWENNQCIGRQPRKSSSRKHDHPTLKGVSRGHRPWRRAAATEEMCPWWKCHWQVYVCGGMSYSFLLFPILFRCFFLAKRCETKGHRSLENALWKICLFFSKEAEQRKEEKIVKKTQIGIVHLCFISIHLWTSIYHIKLYAPT